MKVMPGWGAVAWEGWVVGPRLALLLGKHTADKRARRRSLRLLLSSAVCSLLLLLQGSVTGGDWEP